MGWDSLANHIRHTIEKIKRQQGSITSEQLNDEIEKIYDNLRSSELFEDYFEGADGLHDEWLANIKLRLKAVIVTSIDPDTIIDDKGGYVRWIDNREPEIKWNYFRRYVSYLKDLGRPSEVISSTERSTKAIIERLGDPNRPILDLQKGLVLGAVQSGKTANFNGVINRGVDAGYDLIIVFSGIMEDLRSQTQKRINNDVVGIGEVRNQINQPVGVGEIEPFGSNGVNQLTSLTSVSADFRKAAVDANFGFASQKILVCKKNVGVLTNLVYWFKSSIPEGQANLAKSLLVIDDEADNASLNNLGHKGQAYASKVNGHIRALLNLFSRRSYLGYTATPFANILQDQHGALEEKDAWIIDYRYNGKKQKLECSLAPGLFPDKFIYKLATPSSYLGPKRFFSTGREVEQDRKIPLIETIPPPDEDPLFSSDGAEIQLKKSLTDAIDCFIISIALRDSRRNVLQNLPGFNDHHTMLVHISRLIADQNATADEIKKYVNYVTVRVGMDSLSDPSGIYERLRLQWNRFFAYKVANIRSYLPNDYNADGLEAKSWDEVSSFIPHAVQNISVVAVNSMTGDKLVYPDKGNQKYIAVGGNRLSRGFTLEGLTINYFLRDTNYYDALLQMGRWFGYRPGYIDACRLFIDSSTEEKYDFITAALTELEDQIEAMEIQKKSPDEFELRIRKHPDVLKITRSAILKNAKEVKLSFQNMLHQTVIFKIEQSAVDNAYKSFKSLFSKLDFQPYGEDDGFFVLDTNKDTFFQFLDLPASFLPQPFMKDNVKDYVEKCNAGGKLINWKIAVKTTRGGRTIDLEGVEIGLTIRRLPKKEEERAIYHRQLLEDQIFTASGKSRNIVTSGTDESVGLSGTEIARAEKVFWDRKRSDYIEKNGNSEAEAEEKIRSIKIIPGWVYRRLRPETDGLLLIYLIDQEQIFIGEQLKTVAKKKGIVTETPIIGFALSFPAISNDPGGFYLANEVTPPTTQEYYDESEIPEDLNEITEIL